MSQNHECPTCEREFDTENGVKIHHAKSHGESIAEEIEKTCPECEEAFLVDAQHRDQIHCSEDCRYESERDRVDVECESCGDIFEVVASEADDRRFCSRDCRSDMFNVTIECSQCEDELEVNRWEADHRRFCSRECSHEFYRRELECEECGDLFVVPKSEAEERRFCSDDCFREAMPSKTVVEHTCAECEETFTGLVSRKYCSHDCLAESQRNRVEVTCEHCDGEYEAPANKVERTKYCSWACRTEANRNWIRKQCPNCESVFQTTEYEDYDYCSPGCWNEVQSTQAKKLPRRQCNGCEAHFQTNRNHIEQEFCTLACWHESQRTAETRPDDIDSLLVELYDERDLNHHKTYKRVNTALRDGDYALDQMTKAEVRDRLKELDVWADRSQLAAILADEETRPEDVIGTDTPDGDDSWKSYYASAGGDD